MSQYGIMCFSLGKMFICQLLILYFISNGVESSPCKPLTFGKHKIVCVCDETYCDELDLLSNVPSNQAALYETNKDGARFKASVLNFSTTADPGLPIISINQSEIYQFILGFGGAFTDSAGINIKSMSPQVQKKILTSYFDSTGLEYNMGRIPIASSDFSTKPYSYDDVKDDFNLTYFGLAKEDFSYKIPFIKTASSLSKGELILFGSPWSAPAWMKTNNAMNGQGGVRGNPGEKYYRSWANYLVRFLQAYRENNITLWGLTLQNEPTDGCLAGFPFQAMCFPPQKQRDFLKLDLGPALQKAGFNKDNLKLMIVDDVRVVLPLWADIIMADPSAAQYVSGVAFHWYYEDVASHRLLDITHNKHPDLFLLATEACIGSYPWEFPKADLGNWGRGERYAHDIIQDLLNWSIGWIDWNLVLDMQGGPNWVKNFVDAPIIVNIGKNEFYKEPMYYVLAHFSKCLPRGSFRIGTSKEKSKLTIGTKFEMAAFQTPENKLVFIAVNRQDTGVSVALHDPTKGFLNITINPHSIQTYIW